MKTLITPKRTGYQWNVVKGGTSVSGTENTKEERFECVISRHCQTMSERQAVLQQLANEKSDLTAYAQAMLAEKQAAPASEASAPAASVQ